MPTTATHDRLQSRNTMAFKQCAKIEFRSVMLSWHVIFDAFLSVKLICVKPNTSNAVAQQQHAVLSRYRIVHIHPFCKPFPPPQLTRICNKMKIAVYKISDYFSMVSQFHVENFDRKLSLKFTSLSIYFFALTKKTENSITK